MRMWNADPETMCRNHLLGEHVEMHMFKGSMDKDINMDGYLRQHLVDLPFIKSRHDKLVAEMERRGYMHASPLSQPFVSRERYPVPNSISVTFTMQLYERCAECKEMMEQKVIPLLTKSQTQERPYRCPVCNGLGGRDLRYNDQSNSWYTFLNCHQCNGYGWLKKEPTCIHDYSESFGTDFAGCHVLIQTCKKCGDSHNHDTSG